MLAPRLVTNLCHGIFDRGQFIGVSGALKTDTLFYCRAILGSINASDVLDR